MQANRCVAAAVVVMAALSPMPAGAATALPCMGRAYVTNSYSDSLSVIDLGRNTVLATIALQKGPVNPTISPDGRRLYVSNSGEGTISVLDTATNAVLRTIDVGPLRPTGLAFTPDGKRLVVTFFGKPVPSSSSGEPPAAPKQGQTTGALGARSHTAEGGRVITFFGAESEEVVGTLRVMDLATGKLSSPVTVGMGPERLVILPNGRRAYVANLGSGTVSVIDLNAHKLVATIVTGHAGPFNLAVAPKGDKVFVGNSLSNVISVIDPSTNRVVKSIDAAQGPNGMGFSPNYRQLYVTNFLARSLTRIDTSSYAVSPATTFKEPPGFIRLTPDGKWAYFVSPFGSSISVLDIATMKIASSIPVGKGPSVVAVCGAP